MVKIKFRVLMGSFYIFLSIFIYFSGVLVIGQFLDLII